jgi:phosphatidylserine decarboxylase
MGAPVTFFNRHTNRVETEQIYGEKPLRLAYETATGRLALRLLVRRAVFSRWFGWRMRRPASRALIAPFVKNYGLDPDEFAVDIGNFHSFDDFFSRKLKPAARPIAGDAVAPGLATKSAASAMSTGSAVSADTASGNAAAAADTTAIFPADGRHLGFQNAAAAAAIYAKGQRFDLPALLGDAALAARYAHGALVCSRLCPVDYHRFHFPVAGVPSAPRLANGWLYSVNPVALRRDVSFLWQNKRAVLTLDAGPLGVVTLVVIGATNVGSMTFTHTPGAAVAKGAEAGFFSFGGSFVATLFEPGKVCLAPDLLRETAAGRELYARMGSALGSVALSSAA